MALQVCSHQIDGGPEVNGELQVNGERQELLAHGTYEFPCAGYEEFYPGDGKHVLDWHWHEEVEMIFIVSGSFRVKIPSQSMLLTQGDCMVINGNILHYGAAEEKDGCLLQSFVFHPRLIMGEEGSAIAKNYILPLINDPSFTGYHVPKEDLPKVRKDFGKAFEALKYDQFGYEFSVRENLSHIFLYLYEKLQPQTERTRSRDNDNARIRVMIDFIHRHYGEHLSLREIAEAADIGERECLRCFQKTIQLSPIQYVLKYRVTCGAELLLKNPGETISNIALQCGFDSASNFTKMFRRVYGCTPREYRRR